MPVRTVWHRDIGKEAERTFRVYDEAKEQAMQEIMNGYALGQVAVS